MTACKTIPQPLPPPPAVSPRNRDCCRTFLVCGHAVVHTALGPPADANVVTAGELSARVVLVLARHPYTAAFAAICDHVGELILAEVTRVGVYPVGRGCSPFFFWFVERSGVSRRAVVSLPLVVFACALVVRCCTFMFWCLY